ncbi:MAG: hypothetical protein NZ529_00045 [Cytophagaceae bacterium]|nr:hypothetical protein [Cytophagaceae bacterium]MDW8455156.1 hypothetical protein [Cytophagaceae bacterium]
MNTIVSTTYFPTLPSEARIWIYQANRILTHEEVQEIQKQANEFVRNWKSHEQPLCAQAEVIHRLFLIFAVDTTTVNPGGCSIDKQVHFVKSIQHHYGLNFFDRLSVAYMSDEQIYIEHISTIAQKIKNNVFAKSTLIYDNSIHTLKELNNTWLKPAEQTWLKRYF